ncbi:MAG: TIGR04255 family protein [Acidobacteria bacterium]|nr:TIGR04255 family protein [Acidobacteriota bacterium]
MGALLDLDFFWNEPKEFDLDQFPEWLDRAHEIIYQTFIATIPTAIMSHMRGE